MHIFESQQPQQPPIMRPNQGHAVRQRKRRTRRALLPALARALEARRIGAHAAREKLGQEGGASRSAEVANQHELARRRAQRLGAAARERVQARGRSTCRRRLRKSSPVRSDRIVL